RGAQWKPSKARARPGHHTAEGVRDNAAKHGKGGWLCSQPPLPCFACIPRRGPLGGSGERLPLLPPDRRGFGTSGGRRPETTTAGAFLTGSEEAAAHTPSEHLRTHVRQPWRKEPRSARRVHGTPATPQPARPDRFPDSKPRGRLVLTCGGSDDEVRQRGTRVVGDHVVLQ